MLPFARTALLFSASFLLTLVVVVLVFVVSVGLSPHGGGLLAVLGAGSIYLFIAVIAAAMSLVGAWIGAYLAGPRLTLQRSTVIGSAVAFGFITYGLQAILVATRSHGDSTMPMQAALCAWLVGGPLVAVFLLGRGFGVPAVRDV
jgi:hypothetical protein